MLLNDLVLLFLDSRRRGVTGAKKKCSPATMHIYEDNMRVFTNWLGETHGILHYGGLRRVHLAWFLDFLDKKVADGHWKVPTELQILRTLKTFFRWIDADEECQEAQLKGMQKYLPAIRRNPRRTDIPGIKDVKTYKSSFNLRSPWEYRDYVACCLILDNGIRLEEAAGLRLDHLRLEERTAIVTGKQGPRPVPLSETMVSILKAWLKKRQSFTKAKDSPYVFVSKYADRITAGGLGANLRKHAKDHELPKISSHRLRHIFATNFLKKGGDMEKLRIILGHTTYEMTKEYLHLAEFGSEATKEQVNKTSILKDI